MSEMKIASAKMLQKFQFIATENTKLEKHRGDMFFYSFTDMKIKIQERE